MYGRGAGFITSTVSRTTGLVSVVGGAAVLPNTGSNTAIKILSIATIVAGIVVIISFTATRLLTKRAN